MGPGGVGPALPRGALSAHGGPPPPRHTPWSPRIHPLPPAPCLLHSVKGLRRWPCRFSKSSSCLVVTLICSHHHLPGVAGRGIGLRGSVPLSFKVTLGTNKLPGTCHTGVRRGGLLRRSPWQPPGEARPGLNPLRPAGHWVPEVPKHSLVHQDAESQRQLQPGAGTSEGRQARPAACPCAGCSRESERWSR